MKSWPARIIEKFKISLFTKFSLKNVSGNSMLFNLLLTPVEDFTIRSKTLTTDLLLPGHIGYIVDTGETNFLLEATVET